MTQNWTQVLVGSPRNSFLLSKLTDQVLGVCEPRKYCLYPIDEFSIRFRMEQVGR